MLLLVLLALSAAEAPAAPYQADDAVRVNVIARGGDTFTGAFAFETFTVKTTCGTLAVPAKRVRVASLHRIRPADIDALERKVQDWIAQLGDADPGAREKAERELEAVGGLAIPQLREEKESADAEIRTRVKQLLEKFDADGIRYETSRDTLEGDGFLLRGWIEIEKVELKTRFGKLEIPVRDVDRIEVAEPAGMKAPAGASFVELPDDTFLPVEASADRIRLKTRFGMLEIPFDEVMALEGDEAGRHTVVTGDFAPRGEILNDAFDVRTEFGALQVPKSQLRMLARGEGRGGPARENVALASRGGKATAPNQAAMLNDGVTGNTNNYGWCNNGEFMTLELGGLCRIDEIHVHLWSGDGRFYRYSTEVSRDGKSWRKVADYGQKGEPRGQVVDKFPAEWARYVRIHGIMNSSNTGLHVLELEVYGRAVRK